jgi:hypothetical protein
MTELQNMLKKYSNIPDIKINAKIVKNNLESYLKENSYIETEEKNKNLKEEFNSERNKDSVLVYFNSYEINYDPFENDSNFISAPNNIPKRIDYQQVGNNVTLDRKFSHKFYNAPYKQLKNPSKLVKLNKKKLQINNNNNNNNKTLRKQSLTKISEEAVYFEEIFEIFKPFNLNSNDLYLNNDLIERIYFCPQNSSITLDANESNKIGILLLDYLRIENENKEDQNEYKKVLEEFIEKYKTEAENFINEKKELINE